MHRGGNDHAFCMHFEPVLALNTWPAQKAAVPCLHSVPSMSTQRLNVIGRHTEPGVQISTDPRARAPKSGGGAPRFLS